MTEEVVRHAEFRFQRGTAERWLEVNPILGDGEPGYESDTRRSKVGNGFHAWADLEYTVGEPSPSGGGEFSDPRVGDLSTMTTEAKTTIVEAVNELNYVDVSLLLFYENAKAG